MIRPALTLARREWQALDDALDSCAAIDAESGVEGPDFKGLRDKIRAALAAGERVILCPDALGFKLAPQPAAAVSQSLQESAQRLIAYLNDPRKWTVEAAGDHLVVTMRSASLQAPADLIDGWEGHRIEFRQPLATAHHSPPTTKDLAGVSLVYAIWSVLGEGPCRVAALPGRLLQRGYDGRHAHLEASVRQTIAGYRGLFRRVSFGVYGQQLGATPPKRERRGTPNS